MTDDHSRTRGTLLLRLRDANDEEAWAEFVERYTPKIFNWCRRFSLQESDASDVTQEVLVKLVRAMRSFDYDPDRGSFRGWLKTVTANAVHDLGRSWQRQPRGSGDTHHQQSLAALADTDALAALHQAIEAEHQQEILSEAAARIKLRVQPKTWKAYELTAIEQQPASQVADTLQMPVAEVYVAKSRVLKMMRETVTQLNR